MTMTLPSDKLGDFFSVQLSSKLPVPIVNGIPGQTVTLANQDLTQNVTISRNNSVSGGTIIPPLGSVTVDMSKTIWGTAPTGTLPLLVFPGGGSWAPSPAQVAAQINALGLAKDTSVVNTNLSVIAQTSGGTIANEVSTTGVPLLTKATSVLDTGNQVIAASGQFLSSVLVIGQIGYEVFVQAIEASDGTPLNMVDVELAWTDSTSGLITATDLWKMVPGRALSGSHTVLGSGPTKANRVQVQITNKDTVSCTVRLVLLQNSRVYARDDWRTLSLPGVAGQTLPTIDILANTVASRFIASLGIGAADTTILPLVAGTVRMHWDSGSNTSDCEMVIQAMDISGPGGTVSGDTMYDKFSDGNGNGNDTWTLPRSECKVVVTNHNAAAKQVRWTMVLDELS